MDRITGSLLTEFATEHGLNAAPEDKKFEHFACYITVRRQYNEAFDTDDIVVGAGGDTGIDGIAILVNGTLVTDIEGLQDLAERSAYLDVAFVFVQAERSSAFESAKIGQFGFGVLDFFRDRPTLSRNAGVTEAAHIMSAIYSQSSKFHRGNPTCRLYYVTTGKWVGDATLQSRLDSTASDLRETGLFREVEFNPIGAEGIQRLYGEAKNAISREFTFADRTVIPEIPGVSEAYLGFISGKQFISIISSENGELLKSIFYDNVRDWQDYNQVNSEIRETLASESRSRFVLMNNGITIIARTLRPTGNKFLIQDFQIVNGCQTSHVLFDQRDQIDDSVMIPLRVIATQDEGVITSIIRATNRQTEVKSEQFFAMTDFPKKLEIFFSAFPDGQRLYYERRSRQYDSLSIEKTRIVTAVNLIRAFAAMFLNEPHRTTRNFGSIAAKVGTEIFVSEHKLDPYYVSAFGLYKLEYLFRSGRIEPKYKPARYHILLAARLLVNPAPIPRMNSNEMERYCRAISDVLWNSERADALFAQAATAVEAVAEGNFHRDNIRTQPFTEKIATYCQAATAAAPQ